MEEHITSPISLIGSGAIKESAQEFKKRNFKKAFLVTSRVLFEKGIMKNMTDALGENSIGNELYLIEDVKPDLDIIENGIEFFLKSDCDFIISFGGRDTMKCAKGIAMGLRCYEEENSINCYINLETPLAIVVINSWINDDNNVYLYHNKKVKLSKTINPFMVIIDSELIRNLPRMAMASIGIDSLTYSVEAIVSRGANLASDTFAFEALKILKENLEGFIKGDDSADAREKITYANYLANMAFNNIAIIPGQIERVDGFHTPAFDLEVIDTKMEEVARILGIDSRVEGTSLDVMEEIKRLSSLIDVEPKLRKDENIIMD